MEIADRSIIFIDTYLPFERMEIFRKDICYRWQFSYSGREELLYIYIYILFRKLEIVKMMNVVGNF